MANFKKLIKDIFAFKEPKPQEEFILKEKESEKIDDVSNKNEKSPVKEKKGFIRSLFTRSSNDEKDCVC